MNISRQKLVFALEWALLIGLTIASGWFASGVLQNYISGKSSFSQREEVVKTYPVIVIGFRDFHAPISLDNVKIHYMMGRSTDWKIPVELTIGENDYHDDTHKKKDVISLESFDKKDILTSDLSGLVMYKKIFRILHKTPILDKNTMAGSVVVEYYRKTQNLNDSKRKQWEQLGAGDLAFFKITSVQNSPGIIYEAWKDGKALVATINKNTAVQYHIQPEQYKYLKHAENCQEESYYGCIAQQLEKIGFKNCSKKCMPRIFSNIGVNYRTPFCHVNDTEAEQCVLNIGWDIVVEQRIPSNCKKSCSFLQYIGEIDGITPFSSFNKTENSYIFSYTLTNNDLMSNVFEEYLIYDFIGMIGSVGGTLGMFIGFSVTGIISWCLAYFKNP